MGKKTYYIQWVDCIVKGHAGAIGKFGPAEISAFGRIFRKRN